ncbi:O-antigen ligase family protein [Ancylobacter polymorphus]|uniref:O-antigen ligase family protein n=1 Tax=Ancylobacter polymorphus TaxID=223390 RepID=A0A9E6ZYZ8_9HYPH|nr:O-antigen ligase family protein [Ancylobacter polymorphus]UOK72792.1 O-antigen ligase family protein [Ancylobacter polymorphus]
MALFLKPHGDGGATYGASVLLLFANIVLGGATRAGYLADVLLQFFSLPFLVLAAWLWLDRLTIPPRPARFSFNLACGAAIAVVGLLIALAQLLPLFGAPGWGGVSARLVAAGGQGVAGVAWTGSSSVDPAASLAALPAVLPPLALFLLIALLDEERRLRFCGWGLVFGLLALFLGVLQVMQGPASALRFFEISNRSESVGFFANRNHFAAQLYVTFLMGVAWFVGRGGKIFLRRAPMSSQALWLAGACAMAVFVMAGLALARSRAGILLLLVALAAIVGMAPTISVCLRGREVRSGRVRGPLIVVLAGLVLLVGQLGAERFLVRFEQGLADQLRAMFNEVTWRAAIDALPFGTGLATFTAVFPVYEPTDGLTPQYVNRAHDDWLEFFLETGMPGLVLIALFLVWFGERLYRIWLVPTSGSSPQKRLLQHCASVAVLTLLLHSFVDYPLRTAAMMAYFALCCAFMTPGPDGGRVADAAAERPEAMPSPVRYSPSAPRRPVLKSGTQRAGSLASRNGGRPA